MGSKPFVIFWGATVAAILFLGAIWSTVGSTSPHRVANAIVTVLASLGLAISVLVAGRIILVVGLVQRRARTADHR